MEKITIKDIVDFISNMTIKEAIEFTKELEEKFLLPRKENGI